jgi:hypothetical protein
VRAILLKEVILWVIGWNLENRYGLLMAAALLAFRIGIRAFRRGAETQSARYYCVGGVLVALVWLAQR